MRLAGDKTSLSNEIIIIIGTYNLNDILCGNDILINFKLYFKIYFILLHFTMDLLQPKC